MVLCVFVNCRSVASLKFTAALLVGRPRSKISRYGTRFQIARQRQPFREFNVSHVAPHDSGCLGRPLLSPRLLGRTNALIARFGWSSDMEYLRPAKTFDTTCWGFLAFMSRTLPFAYRFEVCLRGDLVVTTDTFVKRSKGRCNGGERAPPYLHPNSSKHSRGTAAATFTVAKPRPRLRLQVASNVIRVGPGPYCSHSVAKGSHRGEKMRKHPDLMQGQNAKSAVIRGHPNLNFQRIHSSYQIVTANRVCQSSAWSLCSVIAGCMSYRGFGT